MTCDCMGSEGLDRISSAGRALDRAIRRAIYRTGVADAGNTLVSVAPEFS